MASPCAQTPFILMATCLFWPNHAWPRPIQNRENSSSANVPTAILKFFRWPAMANCCIAGAGNRMATGPRGRVSAEPFCPTFPWSPTPMASWRYSPWIAPVPNSNLSANRKPTASNGSAWTSLGGAVRARADLIGQPASRREIGEFSPVQAGGRHVSHLWQTGASGGWSPWHELAGSVAPGMIAARNKDGRLELFGLEPGGGKLLHCSQRVTNGSDDWTGWSSLGGDILPGFGVGRNSVGRLEVIGLNATNGAAAHHPNAPRRQ